VLLRQEDMSMTHTLLRWEDGTNEQDAHAAEVRERC
jgi:hypothetical protein